MTELALPASRPRPLAAAPGLFAGAVFMSAALVFLVEPMMGKLILPQLGGSPAVWNTSLAFFQAALLVGYAYAHALQRWVPQARAQAAIHVAVLLAAALVLPLRLSELLGPPPAAGPPVPWLLAVLTLSVGAPFAALSATAPLMQAWFARLSRPGEPARDPYVLYAASNLGSLLALIAYPALVEPMLTLSVQRAAWSGGYALFVLVAAALALSVARSAAAPAVRARPAGGPARIPWRERLIWVFLAAVPSSLMLGVTSYITTDVASAPFLWVAPLALYLLTFVFAFQARPSVSPLTAQLTQAAIACACVLLMVFPSTSWPLQLGVHLLAFFLSALVCAQALAARRPDPARLTEFYLLMSLGGVIGGSFNAFVAPAIFSQVWEYPAALALVGLARPWGGTRIPARAWALCGAGLAAAALAVVASGQPAGGAVAAAGLIGALAAAFVLRDRGPMFAALVAAVLAAGLAGQHMVRTLEVRRSFFGVHKTTELVLSDRRRVTMLFNGTTVHGAELADPAQACRPLTYYAGQAPIGQVFARMTAPGAPPLRIGAVGLGAGAVAAYTRPGDTLRFFEIDPAVVSVARDSGRFHFLGPCAQGRIDYRLGDARLTLAREPAKAFDLLLIDAFSSDSVPTHLLTVEAMRSYLDKLAPHGILLLHLTNRNLDLIGPAAAVARDAGGQALVQAFQPTPAMDPFPLVARSHVMAVAHDRADLAALAADPRWAAPADGGARAWTDDYTNILGALAAHLAAAR